MEAGAGRARARSRRVSVIAGAPGKNRPCLDVKGRGNTGGGCVVLFGKPFEMRYMQIEKYIHDKIVHLFHFIAFLPGTYYEHSPLMPVCTVIEAVEAMCEC